MVVHLENVEPFLSGTKGMSVIVNLVDMWSTVLQREKD